MSMSEIRPRASPAKPARTHPERCRPQAEQSGVRLEPRNASFESTVVLRVCYLRIPPTPETREPSLFIGHDVVKLSPGSPRTWPQQAQFLTNPTHETRLGKHSSSQHSVQFQFEGRDHAYNRLIHFLTGQGSLWVPEPEPEVNALAFSGKISAREGVEVSDFFHQITSGFPRDGFNLSPGNPPRHDQRKISVHSGERW